MAVDNENAIVNTPATTSETPSNLVAEGTGNELSPNPAGFGFTKQLFVDSLPISGNDKTLYLIPHGNDFLKYKWNLAEKKFERVFDPLPIKLDEGEHKVAKDERVAPQAAPEKVFNGLVVFLGDVKGLEKTTFGKAVINAIGKIGDEKIKQNEATNTTEITNNVEIQGYLKLNGDLIGFDIPIVETDPTSEPATANSPTFVSYNGIIFANVNGEYVAFSAGQVEDGTITKAKFAAGAFDSEIDEDSTNAVQNKVIAAEITKIENGEIVAGKSQVAESLETQVGKLDQTPFSYMSSGGQTDIESGIQRSIKLVGVNLVKNQALQNPTFTSSGNWLAENENVTLSIADGEATVTNTVANYGLKQSIRDIIYKTCIVIFTAKSSDLTSLTVSIGNSNKYVNISQNYQTFYAILTPTTNASVFYLFSRIETGTFVVKEAYVIDLTQRYGSNEVVNAIIGNDTTKQVERLLQFDSNILKDLSYDAGSMLTVKTALLKSTGYNVWDEEYVIAGGTQLKSKNLIRVIPNATYYAYCGTNASAYLKPNFYDINGNYIGTTNSVHNSTFTVPVNCAYIEFYMNSAYGTTYNHDISIFEYWDGSRIGYEPHEEKTETMPNVELNGILKVDGSGNVYADGDELYPDNTKNKNRYGKVDLGTLDWSYDGSRFSVTIDSAAGHAVNSAGNILCSRYQTLSANATYSGNIGISINTNKTIQVKDPAYTDATAFKAAMDGVYLVFELAEEQSLVANSYNPNLWADDFGHLQMLDEDGNEINGLQGCEIFYKANISGFAESLYVRAEGEPENVVIQSERNADNLARDTVDTQLKNALGGTLRQLLANANSIDFLNTDFVDLGELNWTVESGKGFYTSGLSSTIKASANVLSSKYATSTTTWFANNYCGCTANKTLWIYDTAYTDATAFKAAMKGVLLAYEKASE